MKRVFSLLFVIGAQLFLVGFFFVKVVKDDVNVSKFASVAYNENLDKISTSVSLLFNNEIVPEVELIDDTLFEMNSSDTDKEPVKEVKKDEKKDDEIVSTPLLTVDSSKYKDNVKMGFKVTENNKNYSLTGKEFDVVVAVVAGEYDRNLNDALAVVSVILNRCDSKSWASWAGDSPYDQVVMKGQFEVYFEDYYLDYMPGGTKYGKEKYEVAKQAVIDGLNGIRNNEYLGFRAWWVSSYSDKYIVTGGNRYGYN